jgi:nucleotide-binding universal stress UspA family protein
MAKRNQFRNRVYQSIVSAVDFSPQSSAALQMAAELAGQSGGHLTALYVEDASVSLGGLRPGTTKRFCGSPISINSSDSWTESRARRVFHLTPGVLKLLSVSPQRPS